MLLIYNLFSLISELWPLSLIIFGSVSDKNRYFFLLLSITILLSLTTNNLLKEIWSIPLNPHLPSNVFAFPSGHLLVNSILYLSLSLYIRKIWFIFFTIILLLFIGLSTEYYGYHDAPEMIAGFGLSLIFIPVIYLLHTHDFKKSDDTVIIIYAVITCLLEILILSFMHDLQNYLLEPIVGNIGIIMSAIISINYPQLDGKNSGILKIAISIVMIIILMKITNRMFTLLVLPTILFNQGICDIIYNKILIRLKRFLKFQDL